MRDDTREIGTVLERLQRLERQNRVLRLGGLGALLLLGSLFIMGPMRYSGRDKILEAQEFHVVDHNGMIRGRFGLEGAGSGLELLDDNALVRVGLSVTDRTAEISLYDEKERSRFVAMVSGGERTRVEGIGWVRLPSDVFLNLYDADRRTRASFRVSDGTSMKLFDGEQKTLWSAP